MENRYVVYNGKKYAFDLNKIKDFCLTSDKERGRETEIIETFELESGVPTLAAKTNRELKSAGNPQNDTIIYDMIKLFITTLLGNDMPVMEEEIVLDFATTLSLNTMLEMGFLIEIN